MMDTALGRQRCSAKSIDSTKAFSNGASKASAAGIKRINGFDSTLPNIVLINCDEMEKIMRSWNREIEYNPGGWL